jgi:hypothetical protein
MFRRASPHRPLDATHLALHQRDGVVVYMMLLGRLLDPRTQEWQRQFRNGKKSAI